ncbi:Beta-galactosidase [Beutenbergia cavernae DSM 12333]|uniref:Beta-galactosidase n=1 Tax=Beutenbergia cavernae (strain ATCC BAA-8 / DSM 12333 / CCUG 43141 / JCM 11478 / NBRC 16432 / NCIMB 13614 / HKI 0122) TaxID=471853 RepID=C5C1D1_BEUC1|nr:beta-galactosidase [Beutenbergia cavernae]ACQ81541.1 Beta-galactosidase [Beutenbergia cavernae DSM 12333]
MSATPPEPAPAVGPAPATWPLGLPGIGYGGDYNPEQWPLEVRVEDVELMREAGVTIVSVGIFSWAMLEPREGDYDWAWLDDVLDRLATGGIRVALATATATPPPWLTTAHPEILPQRADGTVLHPGGRGAYAVTHPTYRAHVLRMTRAVAERYAAHPALALWHVDNELGCHVPRDYSPAAAAAFRAWLRRRYTDVDTLNAAWGTAFWSQRYSAFDEILPPLAAPTYANPTQQLDFARFSSDAWLDHYRAIVGVLREVTPHVPATTNLMMSGAVAMDYLRWGPELDVVANDHYTLAAEPLRHVDLALSADMTRGAARGAPWILMEHSTSAVNWQPRNRAKAPGEMRRNSLAHVARGADSVMFFQWRASAAGAEKYHSAMLPHAGTDTRVWREVVALGEDLRALAPVAGSRTQARAAVVMDYEAWWAVGLDSHPSVDVTHRDQLDAYYVALWERGITVDVVLPDADLAGYDLLVVPTLYLVGDDGAANLAAAAARGATVLVTYFSGIVDTSDHVRLGGYPGAFRDVLGVLTEEFAPLQEGETVTLDDGTRADVWTEHVRLDGAEAVRSFADGPAAGGPAVTRRAVGSGAAWYAATRLADDGVGRLVEALLAESGVAPAAAAPAGVEVVRRRHADDGASYLFAINHTGSDARVAASGTDLLTGTAWDGETPVPAGGVVVLAEPA